MIKTMVIVMVRNLMSERVILMLHDLIILIMITMILMMMIAIMKTFMPESSMTMPQDLMLIIIMMRSSML